MLDDFDLDTLEEEDGGEEKPSGENRTFVAVAGGLGVLMVIALAFMAIYALVILPRQRAGDQAMAATGTTIVQQEAAARALTETALAQAQASDTPTATKLPTSTQEAAAAAEEAEADEPIFTPGGPTADPRTATVQALLTSAAAAQTQAASSLNTVTPTSTLISALPEAGFLDDTGAPALVGIAVLLVLVIMMVRKLRQASA